METIGNPSTLAAMKAEGMRKTEMEQRKKRAMMPKMAGKACAAKK